MCARCSELEEEVRQLRRELAYEIDKKKRNKIALGFGLTPHEASFVAAHFEAGDRAPDKYALLNGLPSRYGERADEDNSLKILVYRIRKKCGKHALVTVWGRGYVLGAEMRQRVSEVLAA